MKALGVISNFFIPGLGSVILGCVGTGIAQFLIYLVGLVLTLTAILALIGIPMMVGAWLWGMISAATSPSEAVVVNVIQGTPEKDKGERP